MRPTWGQVRDFCTVQGYTETRTDHYHYIKVVAGRHTSGTMVSFGEETKTVPPEMWRMVWRRQLKLINEAEFWTGLEGRAVQYDIPPTPQPQQPLPEYLQRHLRNVLHWPEEKIAQTKRDEAQELLNDYYAHDLGKP